MSAAPDNEAPPAVQMSAAETRSANRLTLLWVIAMLALFPTFILLGMTMRGAQSNLLAMLPAERFYGILTMHGLGMVGLWFVAAMAGVSVVLRKYVRVHAWVERIAFVGTVTGVVMLIVATLIGKYGPGWYFLYPLAITSNGVWQDWATYTFLLANGLLGVSWTIWGIDHLWAIARRYPLPTALGWNYITGKPGPEVPPFITIVTISTIANLAGLISAVVMLAFYALELAGVTDVSDALLMKNLLFLFGHLLVNITMYLGVAMVYDLLPEYAGRPWKNNRWTAAAWNVVLLLIIIAYFHHLYMDFAQYKAVQLIGQVSSYGVAIPSAVVSVYGTLALVWRARMKWSMTSIFMYLGILGWCIGGIGALIDSTIAFNTKFHNTLWVPAHFHTYFLVGLVLMILGAVFHVCEKLSGIPENIRRSRISIGLIIVGGYGFVMMFYLGGAMSIPRRYAQYHELISVGTVLAGTALVFISLVLAGVFVYIWETGRRCVVAFKRA
jgi:cytochrome c oxidase subunit 1